MWGKAELKIWKAYRKIVEAEMGKGKEKEEVLDMEMSDTLV
jgi:hypothetical protein